MVFKCIIVEDQLPAQRVLTRYIEDLPDLALVGSFTSPLEALLFIREEKVDLIFLDIHLPKISGIEFLKLMPYKAKVIMTTAFSEYALEGYEHNVSDYLLKPISFERFLKGVSKVIYATKQSHGSSKSDLSKEIINDFVFAKSGRIFVKINICQIIYIKSEDVYTRVITPDKKFFLSHNLKYWEGILPQKQFCRIHKSYLINFDFLEKIEANHVYLSEQAESLPIGRSFKDAFNQRINLKG